jgi:GntR family transcriptional regulator/MocR family aminotransferase
VWAENLIVAVSRRTGRRLVPYHRQVFTQVRDAILDGTLRAGDRLPASRELARSLRLARNTVARAYDDLLTGGYIEGRVGSGSYVMPDLADTARAAERAHGVETRRTPPSALKPARSDPIHIDFRPGISDWDAFPRRLWLRLIGRALRANAAELRRYGDPGGYFPLREAIARHLAVSRGVSASPDQVMIVNGSQQALDLIARLCLRPGDRAAFEDPCYPEARQVLNRPGSHALFVPVDEEGLDVAALDRMTRSRPAPRLVYLTPSHQFPTGAVLSLARRVALLGWAARRGVLIVEDDYDSEFRTPGRIVESLQGLDRAQRVIYVGTFSTVLFPPLRVGYLVLPPDLTASFLQEKWLADRQTPTLDQLALTAFLQEGHFERHLRAMRRLVSVRREAMRSAIETHLGGMMETPGPSVGMHVMVRLARPHAPARAAEIEGRLVAAAAARGVGVYPVGPCYSRRPNHPTLLLGYASLSQDQIDEGVKVLARAAREALGSRAGVPSRLSP